MEFREVVRRRRMVRDYDVRPVDPAVVDRALAHATHAPSAGFSQGWGFLVLDSPEDVARWWRATTTDAALADPDPWLTGMMRAPVVIVPCSSKRAYLSRYAENDKGWVDQDEGRWPVPFWHMDAAMATLLILLTAVDEGLGSCFFGIPPERVEAVRAEFDIAADHDPVGAITLGHRVGGPRVGGGGGPGSTGVPGSAATRPRRPVQEVVHRGRWRSPDPGG